MASDTLKWWVTVIASSCSLAFIKYVPFSLVFALFGCCLIIVWSEYKTNPNVYETVLANIPTPTCKIEEKEKEKEKEEEYKPLESAWNNDAL
jgi:hypothetical protein